jgi:hypothetical protein
MKQLVQTQPTAVFPVGQTSCNMFRRFFGGNGAPAISAEIKQRFAAAEAVLAPGQFYDPHEIMARVRKGMLGNGLTYTHSIKHRQGYLTSSAGFCQLCDYLKFPKGCQYRKPEEKPAYNNRFLKKVAEAIADRMPRQRMWPHHN